MISPVGANASEAALHQLHDRLLPVLDALPDDGPRLLVEPTAGGGRALAAAVQVPAAPGGTSATLDALEAAVGPGRLGLVHADDSLDSCGSLRDRHATIGAGQIGEAAFAELLARDVAVLSALRDRVVV